MDRERRQPAPGKATESGGSRRCPYCRTTFERGAAILTCPDCSAVHHEECWAENGGCAVWGCEARPAPGQVARDREPEPDSGPAVKARTVIDLDEPDSVDDRASQEDRPLSRDWLESLDMFDRLQVAGIRSGDFPASGKVLRRLAAKLEIPGRSTMKKDELLDEVLAATRGEPLEATAMIAAMNHHELYQVANHLEIAGRSGMSRPKLVEEIKRAMSGSSISRGSQSSSPDTPLPPLGGSRREPGRSATDDRLERLDRVDRFLVAGIRSGELSASRQALRRLAARLEIRGRSSMSKQQLQDEVLLVARGDRSRPSDFLGAMDDREVRRVASALEVAGRSGMDRMALIGAILQGIAGSPLTWKDRAPSAAVRANRQGSGVDDEVSGCTAFVGVAVLGVLLGLVVALIILASQGKL